MPLKISLLSLCIAFLTIGKVAAQADDPCMQKGKASFYAKKFEGRRTASGLLYNGSLYTAAHKTLPFGTRLLVYRPSTGKSVVVYVNDRGPFVKGRIIDLSYAAATELKIVKRGVGNVVIYCLPEILPPLVRKKADLRVPIQSLPSIF